MIEEEQKEKELQERAESRAEKKGKGVEAIGSAEEEREALVKEKIPKQEM